MKAIRIHAYGNAEQLRVEEVPQPQPRPGEILARVRLAGVNPVDWKIREGHFQAWRPAAFPLTLGQDFAGEVANAADDGKFQDGERVFGFASGAYAEYVTASPEHIAPTPAAIGDETAAALPTPGVTAYQVVMRAAELKSGQTVLIRGAAGAVGAIATQLALLQGALVSATAINDGDIAYLKELGVERVIDSRAARFDDHLQTQDAAIDLVGSEAQGGLLTAVKAGGVLVSTVGWNRPEIEEEAKRRGIRAIAFTMTRSGADLAELARLAETGQIRLRVARVLPFEQAREAQEITQRGAARGKVMLRVA